MYVKSVLSKYNWILKSQFGIDLKRFFLSVKGLIVYSRDWREFRKNYAGRMVLKPCLHDRYLEGGTTKSEYFWQDLVVARWISERNPCRHVDIGSRVDGFVAHVASFREIEVFDVRPVTTKVPSVTFREADLMSRSSLKNLQNEGKGYCDSLSCLHAIEHFGLGRYGDPINVNGYVDGINNLSFLLSPNGTLYLSTPVGVDRVEFNAHRVFDPRMIIGCAIEADLELESLEVVDNAQGVKKVNFTEEAVDELARKEYSLVIFTFRKNNR